MQPTRRISRRTVLRAGAAAIGLPLMEAMMPRGTRGMAWATEPEIPVRLAFYYVPNGMHMPAWTPTTTGADYAAPPTLQALGDLRSQALVLSGLSNRNAIDSVPGDHARGTGAFLTARLPRQTEGSDLYNGVSVDQVAAGALGVSTGLPSLQLGLEGGVSVGGCDSGYSCAYTRNISWANETTPLPKLTNPIVAFQRLFGLAPGELTVEELQRQRQRQTSILDYAMDDAASLRVRVSTHDRARLDQYLTGLRELERAILERTDAVCGPTDAPSGFETDLDAYSAVMNEIITQAFACDVTRVVSYMFANGGSNRSYSFLGVTGSHHEISHHQNQVENFERLSVINRYEVSRLADLMRRLDAVTEPDGASLLDRSLIFFSSEIEDGNSHAHTNLPVLLCGGGGGAVRSGRHVRYSDAPIARLYVSMLQAAGVSAASFGEDGDSPLPDLA